MEMVLDSLFSRRRWIVTYGPEQVFYLVILGLVK